MLSLPNLLTEKSDAGLELAEAIRDGKDVSAFGLPFYARTAVAAGLDKRILYVTSDISVARDAAEYFAAVCPRVSLITPRFDVLLYKKLSSDSGESERAAAVYDAAVGEARITVAPAAALNQLYPLRARLAAHAITLEVGREYDLDELKKSLVAAGYRRQSEVVLGGQFAVRGDIVDVFLAGEGVYRAEFFGDTLESLHCVEDGRRAAAVERVVVCPAVLTFLENGEREAARQKLQVAPKLDPDCAARAAQLIEDAAVALDGDGNLDFAAALGAHTTLIELISPELVVFDDAKAVYDTLDALYREHCARFATLFERGEAFAFGLQQMLPTADALACAAEKLAFHAVTTANRIFSPQAVVSFTGTALPSYARDYRLLLADIRAWRQRYNVVLCCGGREGQTQIAEFLRRNYEGFSTEIGGGNLVVTDDFLPHGAILHAYKTVLVGTYDLYAKRAKKTLRRSARGAFVQPETGDYVVHEKHGIGLCEGVKRLAFGGGERDYILIRYRDGQLYLPVENLDSLSKYVAGEGEPKLNKLGGAEFSKIKARVQAAVKNLAIDLAKLYAEREAAKGKVYPPDPLEQAFDDAFPFEETPDQLDAIEAGRRDLADGKIMDRLLCGDVGYGKTEVALRLAFRVILGGGQVAFVSPTTILSRQHFTTTVKRFEAFGVRAVALNRFNTPAETREALQRIASGEADIVCGTHRILSDDVHFKNLGLLILDEEQRFGVADKEKLKAARKNVNVLSLSATPIPRTLHMAMTGIRDISVLDTPPVGRLPVQTFVTEYGDTLVIDAVGRERARGGQVFIVYNRVESIMSFAASVSKLVPSAKIAVAHGQMDEAELARAVDGFTSGLSDILVSSTIIENGVDLPNANTMIVVDADRLGLSQLYQLRGRVGRSDKPAYVYFTFSAGKPLSDAAYKRLEAITQYTELGSGFKIAMADLEIRGAGNVLGREQHGHLEKVGYDMYCKLLRKAVKNLDGEAPDALREVKVDTDYRAYIPDEYIPDEGQRFTAYARIAEVDSIAARAAVIAELKDVYGAVPPPTENLVTVALLKNLAALAGGVGVTLKRKICAVVYERVDDVPHFVGELLGLSDAPQISVEKKPQIVYVGDGAAKNMIKFLLGAVKKDV